MVALDGIDDDAVVEIGESCLHIYGKDRIVCIVIQKGLGKFVQCLCTRWVANRILVGAEGGSNAWCDVFGDGLGDHTAEDGTACNNADATIWLE